MTALSGRPTECSWSQGRRQRVIPAVHPPSARHRAADSIGCIRVGCAEPAGIPSHHDQVRTGLIEIAVERGHFTTVRWEVAPHVERDLVEGQHKCLGRIRSIGVCDADGPRPRRSAMAQLARSVGRTPRGTPPYRPWGVVESVLGAQALVLCAVDILGHGLASCTPSQSAYRAGRLTTIASCVTLR
jgi:hypothetical protein